MRLQAFVVLLSVLLNGGFCLKCYECGEDETPCTNVHTCKDTQKCASVREGQYIAGIRREPVSKQCMSPSDCKSFSVSMSAIIFQHSVQCCDTDGCNDQAPPALTSGVFNGKKCFSCDWEGCKQTLSCWENEDYCFTKNTNDQASIMKGCASKSVCDDQGSILGMRGNMTCCTGNLCNGVHGVTQSFLFLCGSLLSFIILH